MDRLIPAFIAERFRRGEWQGSFEGSGLFVDISGFSRLTDVAFALGEVGAELIGREIPRLFDLPVREVIGRGGIITHFAGDAFLVLFPGDDGRMASRAATVIITHFQEHGRSETPHGAFEFSVKCGVDVGTVQWGIVRGERAAGWYFRGGPVEGATTQQGRAGRGEVSCSAAVTRLEKSPEVHGTSLVEPANDHETLSSFFDKEILLRGATREIRPVVAAFLSFVRQGEGNALRPIEEHATIEELFRAVHDHLPPQGRAYSRLLIDDKGLNVLAYFGAPQALEHAEEGAVGFASELRSRLWERLPDVRMRAGVDRGLVYAGLTGGELRHEPAFLGDCVNTAVRLMTGASWGEIHVSGRVAEAVGDTIAFTELPAAILKGKSRPEAVFRYERRMGGDARAYRWPMTGRKAELADMHRLMGALWEGRFAGMAYVYGEPGMGKTRFVAEFRREVERTGRSVTWIELPCGENDSGLQPIRTWLYSFFGISPFTPREETRARILAVLADVRGKPVVGEETRRELQRIESFLAALVECRWEGSLYEQVTDAKLRFENQIWGIRELIRALAADRPVVVQVEDGHWAEPSTEAWLGVMTRAVADVSLVVVLTSRYAEDGTKPRIAVDADVPVVEVELGRLDRALIRDQVRTLVGGEPDEALLGVLGERSGGNPFFVEQLMLHAVETGLLHTTAASDAGMMPAVSLRGESGRLPQTLETVLLARFDRLDGDLREGLKHAATLGVRFLRRVLEELLGRSREFGLSVGAIVPRAEEEGMIVSEARPAVSAEDAYLFRHVLMREAAYHLQPPALREYLHGVAADVLEELFGGREDMLVTVADHLGKAGRLEREAEVVERAAAAAKRGYRNEEAIALFTRLRERLVRLGLAETERMVEALYGLAAVQWLIGDWVEARGVTQEGVAVAERVGTERLVVDGMVAVADRMRNMGEVASALDMANSARDRAARCGYAMGVARATGVLGIYYWSQGDYGRALEVAHEQLRCAQETGDAAEIAKAIGAMGIYYWSQHENERALECFEDWQRRAEAMGDPRGVGRAIGNRGLVYWNLGEYQRALECYEEQFRRASEVGDRESMILALGNSGNVFRELGDFSRALECFREWERRAGALGDKRGQGGAIGNQASVYLHLGMCEQALDRSEKHIQLATEVGDRAGVAFSRSHMGHALLGLGRHAQALDSFQVAARTAGESGDKRSMTYALTGMGLTHLCRGEHTSALECCQGILSTARSIGSRTLLAEGMRIVALAHLATGKTDEAAEAATEAVEITRTLKTRPALIDPLLALAEVQARRGDTASAREALAEVRAVVEELKLCHRIADIDRVAACMKG